MMFDRAYLVTFNDRILAVGELLISLVAMSSKERLTTKKYLHFRWWQAVRRVNNNVRLCTSGKNLSIASSVSAFFQLPVYLRFSECPNGDICLEAPSKHTGGWWYLGMFHNLKEL